jgi:DNA-binding NarL/FixJ family response regulator
VRTETVVHIIEPQKLFVPELIDVFSEAGLTVGYVGDRIDPERMLADDPDVVFLDTDEIENPNAGVRTARKLAPNADIFVYVPTIHGEESFSFTAAGADVVIQKSVSRRELVQRLRESDRRRRIRRGP